MIRRDRLQRACALGAALLAVTLVLAGTRGAPQDTPRRTATDEISARSGSTRAPQLAVLTTEVRTVVAHLELERRRGFALRLALAAALGVAASAAHARRRGFRSGIATVGFATVQYVPVGLRGPPRPTH